jgi:UPF0716 protein FxsA
MFLRLLLLLTLVPVVELTILLEVHRGIANTWGTGTGLLVTFGSIILSGVIGATLIRRQGLAVLRTIRVTMARGEFPAHSLVDGALVLVGGTLLLTPGFLTDVVGFTLLIPWTRRLWRRIVLYWLRLKLKQGTATIRMQGVRWTAGSPGPPEQRVVIDVTPRDEKMNPP